MVGVARDIRYRLSGLAVDRDPIRLERYFRIVVSDDFAVSGQHIDDLRFIAVRGGSRDVGCDNRVGTDAATCPVPVVHERLHGDVAPIGIVISAAGGAVFFGADRVTDVSQSVRHRGKPGKQLFSPFGTKIEMTGLGTPGGHVCRQFDVDRYLLDGCRDMEALEISDEVVRPDLDIAAGLRCLNQLRPGIEKLHEAAAVRQSEVDGDPWREWTVRADVRLCIEDHDNGRTTVEMSIEVPPFIAALLRTDALPILKLRYVNGGEVKSLVIGGTIRQPKVAILAAMHRPGFSWHVSIVTARN